MTKKIKNSVQWIIILIIILILSVAADLFYYYNYSNSDSNIQIPDNYVARIIDGDTFVAIINNTEQTVRLLCIDAPELGAQGSEEAKAFLESLILNKEVRLEKDISETDKYNRLLRYVWVNVTEEEIFVNQELVHQGYASIFIYGNDTKRCGEL